MDFPEAEKVYTHVSVAPLTDVSSEVSDSPHPSVLHVDPDQELPVITKTTTSKSYRPGLNREITRITTKDGLERQFTRITTHGTTYTLDPDYEVDWEIDDPRNPRNWSMWYKAYIIFCISFSTLMVVLYSTSYTAAMGEMQSYFGIENEETVTLGVTTYLLGLAAGSLVLAPIGETFGRRWVYVGAMGLFVLLAIPAALAQNIETILVVRFFAAFVGSATIANAPGTIGDLISDKYRATAFSIWSIGPMNGPVFGPVIGGFVTQYKGWRWSTWVVMIGSGAALIMLYTVRETYAPALLQQKAKRMRKEEDDERYWSRYDIRVPFVEMMKVNLSRPFIMAATEPICIFWNVYIGVVYGILYLCFVAYPIVFQGYRGWSVGISGLAFLGIGIGSMITICSAGLIRRLIDLHKPDHTGKIPPEASISVVCIAAILIPVGELWFAWSCYPTTIHWSISIAAGVPFGAGNGAVFIYASNYLVYSYGIYAASAMAGNALIRSVLGATLPLAGPAMYRALGPNWAGTVLGLLEVLIIPIPFIFYKYGFKIREKSRLISSMRENEERAEKKKQKALERLQRLQAAGVATGPIEEAKVIAEEMTREDVTESDSKTDVERDADRGPGVVKFTGVPLEKTSV